VLFLFSLPNLERNCLSCIGSSGVVVPALRPSVLGVDVELLFLAGSSMLLIGEPLVFALVGLLFLFLFLAGSSVLCAGGSLVFVLAGLQLKNDLFELGCPRVCGNF